MSDWLRPDKAGGFCLSLYIQPGAKKNEVAGLYGDALKIRLAAPPVDGKANAALLDALSAWLRRPKRAFTLQNGQTSRRKQVHAEGVTEEELRTLAAGAG